jgi:hypothetical protein
MVKLQKKLYNFWQVKSTLLFPKVSGPALEPKLCLMLSSGVERSRNEADQWPPSRIEVKNEWRQTSTMLYIFKACTWTNIISLTCALVSLCVRILHLRSVNFLRLPFLIYSLPAVCPANRIFLNFITRITFMKGTNKFIRAFLLKQFITVSS